MAQLPTLEARTARLEGIVEQITQQLASLNEGQRDLSNRLTHLENRMLSFFKWVIGLLFAILLTIFGATVTILLNLPR